MFLLKYPATVSAGALALCCCLPVTFDNYLDQHQFQTRKPDCMLVDGMKICLHCLPQMNILSLTVIPDRYER